MDAIEADNQIAFQDALDAAGITYADENKMADYMKAIDEADEAPEDLADIQAIIDEFDEGAVDEAANEAKVKAVAAAKTQKQLLTALTENFELVNPDWIVKYSDAFLGAIDVDSISDFTEAAEGIQDAIYNANKELIDEANEDSSNNLKAKTAAEQAKITALIEKWMQPDDPEDEDDTDKAEAIYASQKAEAEFKLTDAKTANQLYNALVAYANFIADEDTPNYKAEDVKQELKSSYWGVMEEDRDDLVEAIQEGNLNVKEAILDPGVEAAEDAALAAVNEAKNANQLLAALKAFPGLENVVDANKDFYWADDNGNFDGSKVTDADGLQGAVDEINIGRVNDADDATKLLAALKAYPGLKNVVDANKDAYFDADFSSVDADGIQDAVDDVNHDVIVDAQVEAINEAEKVAEVKAALDELANLEYTDATEKKVLDYLKIRSVDRDFVAAYVLDERPDTPAKYADLKAIANKVESAQVAYTSALGGINALTIADVTDVDKIVNALEATLDENFLELKPVQRVPVAEAFFDKLVFNELGDLKTPFKSLAAVKELL